MGPQWNLAQFLIKNPTRHCSLYPDIFYFNSGGLFLQSSRPECSEFVHLFPNDWQKHSLYKSVAALTVLPETGLQLTESCYVLELFATV